MSACVGGSYTREKLFALARGSRRTWKAGPAASPAAADLVRCSSSHSATATGRRCRWNHGHRPFGAAADAVAGPRLPMDEGTERPCEGKGPAGAAKATDPTAVRDSVAENGPSAAIGPCASAAAVETHLAAPSCLAVAEAMATWSAVACSSSAVAVEAAAASLSAVHLRQTDPGY